MSVKIKRSVYADHVRADHRATGCGLPTLISSSRSRRISRPYGEEVKFGGRQGDPRRHGSVASHQQAGCGRHRHHQCAHCGPLGIVKADVAIKEGMISAIGKAGNPDIQPGVTIVIGPRHRHHRGRREKILTAGGFDSHIHFICPQQIEHALMSGVTSMLGGGTGPSHGTFATTCTPRPLAHGRMIQSFDAFPVNLGISGKGNASRPASLVEMIKAGACALKLHEDWGQRHPPRSTIALASPTTTTSRSCCIRTR